MTKRIAETSMFLWADRHMPGHAMMDQARALEASGVVDGAVFPDHMVNLFPPSLWTPENSPMANVLGDLDSLHNAVVMATLAHAAAPKLKITLAGDPGHMGPGEWCQLMWSLANVTEGGAQFQFGPGEIKNLKPFGHKRSEGLARLEDLFRASKALWEADGPIDFVGKHCELKQAYLGGVKSHRPKIWSMGTGPKQVDLATTLCDGICGSIPTVWTHPDHTRAEIEKLKRMLVEKGRDPETFGFGAYCFTITHEDPETVSRALDNPIIRWLSGMIGRVNPGEWRKEGIEPATPEGWAYFLHMVPYETGAEFVQEVISKTTREMAEKSFIFGSPAEVARQLQEHVDAGLTWISPFDSTAIVLEPADAAKSFERSIEVFRRLKGVPVASA